MSLFPACAGFVSKNLLNKYLNLLYFFVRVKLEHQVPKALKENEV